MAQAPDPFKTNPPLTKRGRQTFDMIDARLRAMDPPIVIEDHIAQSEKQGQTAFSSLEAHDSTLDGINFVAVNPCRLASAFDGAKDQWGDKALASTTENPDHWALKVSFAATIGTGWREAWREAPYAPPAVVPSEPESAKVDNLFRMRFGTTGSPISFTALHCAVDTISGRCNVHIDEAGFVLALPQGIALTPDLYGHIMNELKFKTEFRDWLAGKMPNEAAAQIVKEVIRRISITFPNALNGYAGLAERINFMRTPRNPIDVILDTGKIFLPTGVVVDLYEKDGIKVQVTGTIAGGDRTITVSVGGNL